MADIKYSELTAASGLIGPELVSVNQGSGTVRTTVSLIQTYSAITPISVLSSALNVVADLGTAGATLTITVDQIVVGTSLSGSTKLLSSLSLTNNLGVSGAGGLDTGTASSGFVAVYVIYNSSTLVTTTLATLANSAAAPEIYGGANMPSGYTYSRLISVRPLSASNTYQVGYQKDKTIWIPEVSFGIDTLSSWVSTDISSAVPKNAKSYSARAIQICNQSETHVSIFTLSGVGANVGAQTITEAISSNLSIIENTVSVPIFTAQRTFVNITGGNFVSGGGFVISSYSF